MPDNLGPRVPKRKDYGMRVLAGMICIAMGASVAMAVVLCMAAIVMGAWW